MSRSGLDVRWGRQGGRVVQWRPPACPFAVGDRVVLAADVPGRMTSAGPAVLTVTDTMDDGTLLVTFASCAVLRCSVHHLQPA